MTSFSVVSLIAMVPESECRMPILMVSSAARAGVAALIAPPSSVPAVIVTATARRDSALRPSVRPLKCVSVVMSVIPMMLSRPARDPAKCHRTGTARSTEAHDRLTARIAPTRRFAY